MKYIIDPQDRTKLRQLPDMEKPNYYDYLNKVKFGEAKSAYNKALSSMPTLIRNDNGEFEAIEKVKGCLEEGIDFTISHNVQGGSFANNTGMTYPKAATPIKTQEQKSETAIGQLVLDSYYAGFNQAHYGLLHPDVCPPKECESAGLEYLESKKGHIAFVANANNQKSEAVEFKQNTAYIPVSDKNPTERGDYFVIHQYTHKETGKITTAKSEDFWYDDLQKWGMSNSDEIDVKVVEWLKKTTLCPSVIDWKGLRWVKASERLPEKDWKGALRIDNRHYSAGKFELGTIRVELWTANFYAKEADYPRIEWLEETDAASQDQQLIEVAQKISMDYLASSSNTGSTDVVSPPASACNSNEQKKEFPKVCADDEINHYFIDKAEWNCGYHWNESQKWEIAFNAYLKGVRSILELPQLSAACKESLLTELKVCAKNALTELDGVNIESPEGGDF